MNKEPMYLNHLATVPDTPTTLQQAALWLRTRAQLVRNRKRFTREEYDATGSELIAAYALLTVDDFRERIEARILEGTSGPSLRPITPARHLQVLLMEIMYRRWRRRQDRRISENARTGIYRRLGRKKETNP